MELFARKSWMKAKKAQLEKIKEELKDKQKSFISIETTHTKTWWLWLMPLEKDGFNVYFRDKNMV